MYVCMYVCFQDVGRYFRTVTVYCMCDIVRANSLNTQEANMCDKEVLKSHATKMLHISLQRISNVVTSSYLSVHSIVKLLSDC